MKTVVLGRGFLGQEFEAMGYEVWGRDKIDFQRELDTTLWCKDVWWRDAFNDYDVIINCIGQSNTRYCEEPKNFDEIMFINGMLDQMMVQALSRNLHSKVANILENVIAQRNAGMTNLTPELRASMSIDLINLQVHEGEGYLKKRLMNLLKGKNGQLESIQEAILFAVMPHKLSVVLNKINGMRKGGITTEKITDLKDYLSDEFSANPRDKKFKEYLSIIKNPR